MSLEDVFIARQPIFDRCSTVAGYELLFRSGPVRAARGVTRGQNRHE